MTTLSPQSGITPSLCVVHSRHLLFLPPSPHPPQISSHTYLNPLANPLCLLSPQNDLLNALVTRSKPADESAPTPYKYVVNSTIIQHLTSPAEAATGGRRGMHSAVAAYWNAENDGMWTYKWEGAEAKGMDVVLSVTWIAV